AVSNYNIYSHRLALMKSLIHFIFIDTMTTYIYTLSLHDALPIYHLAVHERRSARASGFRIMQCRADHAVEALGVRRSIGADRGRSEEHTSELQSPYDLVCRLLLEKKKDSH